MCPISGTFDGLEDGTFKKVREIRDCWANCDILEQRKQLAQKYWVLWSDLSRQLESERSERKKGGIVAPFCWRTREGAVIESMCVRLETICTCVALAEQTRKTLEEKRWLYQAWVETQKWIRYPNYCLPVSVREDYLAARFRKLLLLDEFGKERTNQEVMWAAVVEREMDDIVRTALKTYQKEDHPAYFDLLSGGENLTRAYLATLESEESKKRDENEVAYLAMIMDKEIIKRCPGAESKDKIEILYKRDRARYKQGKFDMGKVILEKAEFDYKKTI
jgi:hypothetical protein